MPNGRALFAQIKPEYDYNRHLGSQAPDLFGSLSSTGCRGGRADWCLCLQFFLTFKAVGWWRFFFRLEGAGEIGIGCRVAVFLCLSICLLCVFMLSVCIHHEQIKMHYTCKSFINKQAHGSERKHTQNIYVRTKVKVIIAALVN